MNLSHSTSHIERKPHTFPTFPAAALNTPPPVRPAPYSKTADSSHEHLKAPASSNKDCQTERLATLAAQSKSPAPAHFKIKNQINPNPMKAERRKGP